MMNRAQLQAEVAIQADAIAAVQARLKSEKLSRTERDSLEREILERVHLRYITLQDLRRLGK
jgi:hypothetical protein